MKLLSLSIIFLKEAKTKKKDFDPGKRVIVVGGGDVAIDCATTAKLLGAEDVRILYRRSIEEAPANINEFHYALSLGIGITTGLYPVAATGTKTKIKKVEVAGFYDNAAKAEFSVDTLVFATGQVPEDMSEIMPDAKLDPRKGLIKATKGKAGGKFFAGGDVVNGGKTVVQAVAEGKEAAEAMIAYLEKKGVK